MKGKLVAIIMSSLVLSNAAWADMFCPNGFNSISMGDSVASVTTACGKPDSKKTYKKAAFQAQEWVYYIASYPGMPGTLKATIAFDDKGSVVNISVNGAGVTQTQICNNQTIQFGDTPETIKAACGKPAYTNIAQNGEAPKVTEYTELQYNSSPAVTLIFQDGKLTKRNGG